MRIGDLMKYLVIEGKVSEIQKYNAFGKARGDVCRILGKKGFKDLRVQTKSGVQKQLIKKPLQYIQYYKNYLIWKKTFRNLTDEDLVLIQYPLINNCLFFSRLLKKNSKKVNIITLIHDLDSIRFRVCKTKSVFNKIRVSHEDKTIGKYSNYVISHNKSMTRELVSMGVDKKKIINLELFDYLEDLKVKSKVKYNTGIIIAGNLSIDKAKYISYLKDIKKTKFNLYGVNYDDSCNGENINYKGAFLPDELIKNLSGSYGLVWDGDSIDICSGMWGNYLRYNNPHKTSLYLAAGLPVIVWKDAALAEYIEKNNLGIAVTNLKEIDNKTKKITEQEYKEMCKNVDDISKKLKKGFFLENAINKIEKEIKKTNNG